MKFKHKRTGSVHVDTVTLIASFVVSITALMLASTSKGAADNNTISIQGISGELSQLSRISGCDDDCQDACDRSCDQCQCDRNGQGPTIIVIESGEQIVPPSDCPPEVRFEVPPLDGNPNWQWTPPCPMVPLSPCPSGRCDSIEELPKPKPTPKEPQKPCTSDRKQAGFHEVSYRPDATEGRTADEEATFGVLPPRRVVPRVGPDGRIWLLKTRGGPFGAGILWGVRIYVPMELNRPPYYGANVY